MKKKPIETTVTIPGLVQDNLRETQEFEKVRCTIRRAGSNTAVTIHAGVMAFTFQAATLLNKIREAVGDENCGD